MKPRIVAVFVAAAVAAGVLFSAIPAAQARVAGVGLGASVGAVFPNGALPGRTATWSDVGLAWGFWVDIPIAWKFHISPSASLYDLGGGVGERTATDICLNFKFIIPAYVLKVFFGLAGGVTYAAAYAANAGVGAGISFPVWGGIEFFVASKYKVVIRSDNIHAVHVDAGLLFVF